MVIVEMIGSPGAGKTTLIKEIYKIQNYKDNKILFREDLLLDSKKERYLFVMKSLLNLKYFKLNFSIISYVFSYPISLERVHLIFQLLIFLNRILRIEHEGKEKLLLLDEGIAQMITSIPHENKLIQNKKFCKMICNITNYFGSIIRVYCNIDLDENLKRIRKRNLDNHRFDTISNDDELKKLLIMKRKNLEIAFKSLDVGNNYEINILNSNDKNTKYVNEIVERMLK